MFKKLFGNTKANDNNSNKQKQILDTIPYMVIKYASNRFFAKV